MFIIILLKTVIYLYINSFSVIRILFQFKTLKLLLHLKFQYFGIKLHVFVYEITFRNICNLKVS